MYRPEGESEPVGSTVSSSEGKRVAAAEGLAKGGVGASEGKGDVGDLSDAYEEGMGEPATGTSGVVGGEAK